MGVHVGAETGLSISGLGAAQQSPHLPATVWKKSQKAQEGRGPAQVTQLVNGTDRTPSQGQPPAAVHGMGLTLFLINKSESMSK